MKKPTHRAAKELGIHPANLIFYLSTLSAPFEDCWPQIDDAWLQTLIQTHRELFNPATIHLNKSAANNPILQTGRSPISESALKILDKLHRKRHWGKHTISWRTLHNDYCPSVPNLKDAVRELQESHLLLGTSVDDPLSLNPSKTKEIDELVTTFRASKH
jgi:hypothetical protein